MRPDGDKMINNYQGRLISFYLPQFHPTPENDAWWGKGFTEWHNVTRARPLFQGHYQPHLPADLGFYDLRVPETRQAQADLARAHGIHGFCYYHYWFEGKRLLERPFKEVLASGEPDFPFCLCWANENWTRRWDGLEQEMLIEQTYSEADDLAHIRYLIRAFEDPRYIRVEGKPLFLVYHTHLMPDLVRTTSLWRKEVQHCGFPGLYLARVEAWPEDHGDPEQIGFDAAVDFQPDWTNRPTRIMPRHLGRIGRKLFPNVEKKRDPFWFNSIYQYADLARVMMARPEPAYKLFPGVAPSWDNSARRKAQAMIFTGSTPGIYGNWLRHAIATTTRRFVGEERLVFINAWNEWAEGNHLEPDEKWGLGYLEATLQALEESQLEGVEVPSW